MNCLIAAQHILHFALQQRWSRQMAGNTSLVLGTQCSLECKRRLAIAVALLPNPVGSPPSSLLYDEESDGA